MVIFHCYVSSPEGNKRLTIPLLPIIVIVTYGYSTMDAAGCFAISWDSLTGAVRLKTMLSVKYVQNSITVVDPGPWTQWVPAVGSICRTYPAW